MNCALPISPILAELTEKLSTHLQVILQAPPGAGKTTQVPLHLLQAPWLNGKKILMLEPRRIAARSSATYMAKSLGEAVGETVGFRVRQDSQIGPKTQIEVITGGVFLRMLQEDPSLESTGLVIFDEFHERSLDNDLGLSLSLYCQSLLRSEDPLRLLVMSATLDTQGLEQLLPQAPVITSSGRMYPVQMYFGKTLTAKDSLAEAAGAKLLEVLGLHPGNALVFLPGQREIQQCQQWLCHRLPADVKIFPLYASLPLQQQQSALAVICERKVVLATNIAETSLTIDGITLVIDSGFCREVEFDPNTGLSRLNLKRISKASATQRAGRAGRLAPGHCFRLWSQELVMSEHSPPEILKADLAPLVLQLISWGVTPADLAWITPPPQAAYQQAVDVLVQLNALSPTASASWQLTPMGQQMSQLPVAPRLAHMMVVADTYKLVHRACLLAAILSEASSGPADADLEHLVDLLTNHKANLPGAWRENVLRQSKQFMQLLSAQPVQCQDTGSIGVGFLLACAYPDRIAKARPERRGMYQLANGRAASIDPLHPLSKHPWLVVALTQGSDQKAEDRILLAAPFDAELFNTHLTERVTTRHLAAWDKKLGRFTAIEQRSVGAIVLQEKRMEKLSAAQRSTLLLEAIQEEGLDYLNWSDEAKQMRARLHLACELEPDRWPAGSPQALLDQLPQWLGPYLEPVFNLQQLHGLNLAEILLARLDWKDQQALNLLLPSSWRAPTGTEVTIDYQQNPPVLAVKLQEMFGTEQTPSVYSGRVKLAVHLLSPARRPLQITQDLGGFWRSSYQEVKKEMKGRYPKHPWPDDPLTAPAQRGVKSKGPA